MASGAQAGAPLMTRLREFTTYFWRTTGEYWWNGESVRINHRSASEIIHQRQGFNKVCAKRVTQNFAHMHKQKRFEITTTFWSLWWGGWYVLVKINTGNKSFLFVTICEVFLDLALSKYHLFRPLKHTTGPLIYYRTSTARCDVARRWYVSHSKHFCTAGIAKLMYRWKTCVEKRKYVGLLIQRMSQNNWEWRHHHNCCTAFCTVIVGLISFPFSSNKMTLPIYRISPVVLELVFLRHNFLSPAAKQR